MSERSDSNLIDADENVDDLDNSFDRLLIDSDEEFAGLPVSDDEEESPLVATIPTSDDSDDDSDVSDDESDDWNDDVIAQPLYPQFDARICTEAQELTEPIEFYELFMADVWDLLVTETNKYAAQKGSRGWRDTDVDEMKKFFGLCLKMGQVKLPYLRDYWNTSGELTDTPVAASVMTRARFEAILQSLHLADNNFNNGSDRLYKISPLVNIFNATAERSLCPGSKICVDESLVPFRGRIVFRQYLPSKRHRYGIKLFKLCTDGGYTCKLKVYAGKEASQDSSVGERVVLHLVDNYLDNGRDLYTDNFYTCIPLAKKLIARHTDLIGTCRRNRKGLPKEVVQKKLKKGNLIVRQDSNGIMVLKWKDKRDIIMLSTRHDAELNANSKPKVIDDYNVGKMFVDISDQMCSYSPFIRKTSKWYIRLLFHIITQTMMINAWTLYRKIAGDIKLNVFKRKVFVSLLNPSRPSTPTTKHQLEKIGTSRESRKRCTGCYHDLAKNEDSRTAGCKAKRVPTRCTKCQKHYCLDCFNTVHLRCFGK